MLLTGRAALVVRHRVTGAGSLGFPLSLLRGTGLPAIVIEGRWTTQSEW